MHRGLSHDEVHFSASPPLSGIEPGPRASQGLAGGPGLRTSRSTDASIPIPSIPIQGGATHVAGHPRGAAAPSPRGLQTDISGRTGQIQFRPVFVLQASPAAGLARGRPRPRQAIPTSHSHEPIPTSPFPFPRAHSHEPIPTSPFPRAHSHEPIPTSPFPRAHSHEPIPTSPFPRAHSHEPIPTSPFPRAHSHEPIPTSPFPRAHSHDGGTPPVGRSG